MFYSTIMKIDSIDRLRDIRDALLVERSDEVQATLDKAATKNLNRNKWFEWLEE